MTRQPATAADVAHTLGFYSIRETKWYCFRAKGHDGDHANYLHPDAAVAVKHCGALFDAEAEASDGIDVERLEAAMTRHRTNDHDPLDYDGCWGSCADAIAAAYGPPARSPEAQAGEERLREARITRDAFRDLDTIIGQLRENGYSDWPDWLTSIRNNLRAALRESGEGSGG